MAHATSSTVPGSMTGTGNVQADTVETSGPGGKGSSGTPQGAGQDALVPVATRNNTYYLGVNGSSATQTFRSKHKAACDITSVALMYGNSYSTSGGPQGDGPTSLTVACSVEPVAGTIFRGFFSGAPTGTVAPGAVLYSDPVGCFIPKGTFFFVRTYVSGNYPLGMTLNYAHGLGQDTTGDPSVTSDSGEGVASPSGTDVTASGSISSAYVTSYSPFCILGTTRTLSPVFVVVGDSIANYSDEAPDMGWVTRALANQWPLVKTAQPGETMQEWVTDGTSVSLVEARRRLFRYGTHFVFADGRNDLSGGRTLAQIQADMITAWNMAMAQGGVSWQATITPKVTTTDQYSTLGNQTTDASDPVRVNLNTWIRDGAPLLSGAAAAAGLGSNTYVAAQPAERVIRITAKKFEFLPHEVTLKKGVPVVLEFVTADVVMGFNAPELGVRADIVPGKVAQVRIVPQKLGTFEYLCDIFCGQGHEEMSGKIIVIA